MKTTIELVYGLPQKELVERLHFHQRQNEVSERALGFYLLDMQRRNAFQPEKDAASWAYKHLQGCRYPQKLMHLAECLEDLPRMAEAFSQAEVPWTKIREVARVATAETEDAWLDFAKKSTSREIEREVMGKKHGDKPGEGFKARRIKFIERLMFSAAGKVIWDQAIRKIPKGYRHNTSSPFVTIRYAFHPLAGTRFCPARACPGPPPIFVLQLPERRLAVPVWMTEEWAAALKLADAPSVTVDQLLELAGIVEKELSDFEPRSCILPPETVSEEDHKNGEVDSAPPSDRLREGQTRPTHGGSGGSRQSRGKPASSGSERRGRKGS